MKQFLFILLIINVFILLPGYGQDRGGGKMIKADTVSVDSVEYELIIFDPAFDTWLLTQPPKEYLSQNYYEFMNRLFVSEWNYRYSTARGHGEYDSYIDYNSNVDYGQDLNYRLFYYFRYFEKKHNTRLIPTAR